MNTSLEDHLTDHTHTYTHRPILFHDLLWNNLPNHVVLSDTVNTLKSKLDKFWQHQPIIYDFKAEILGTGSRSWY